tara:strand:+ start:318 stop:509 length:192 start_codon:yes stop_codon:yes gene_type:complete
MKSYLILFLILLALPVQAENAKPSKPVAGQTSGNTSSPKTQVTNTYNSNQIQNTFTDGGGVMP